MRYRKLGRTGIEVSEVGYGAWGVGGGQQWKGGGDDESLAALRRAFELGVNFIDTAYAYNEGHSEKLVAEGAKSAPHPVYIATKVPPKNRIWPARLGIGIEEVFPYDYVVEMTEKSLRNLGAETIDLQQFHVWNPEWIDSGEWRRAVEDLKQAGKIRFFGISINDHQPDSALEAVRTGLVDVVQVIYNIFDQSPEANLFPLVQEANVGVLARVPLDEGALTGAITASSKFEKDEFRAFYFQGDRPRQVEEHVNALKKDLEGVPGSLAEIALQFCLSHPAVSTVIPGMRRIRNVESSCAVPDRGALPAAVLEKLRSHAWEKNFYS
jgi:aryl-alcohol dehydrogenase-like predicted oxidoreductase